MTPDATRYLGAFLLVSGAIVLVLLAANKVEPRIILSIPGLAMIAGSYLAHKAGA